jgi:hypothetical protein
MLFKEDTKLLQASALTLTLRRFSLLVPTLLVSIFTRLPVRLVRDAKSIWEQRITAL